MRGSLLRVPHTLKQRVFTGLFVALVSIFGAFYSAGAVHAEVCTWDGDTDTLFSTAGNWDCTPSADDDFVLNATAFDADLDMAAINSLTVAAGYTGSITQSVDTSVAGDMSIAGNGGSYKIADTKVLTLAGSLTVTGAGIFNGDFAASTTVQMTGAAKTIGGDGSTTFDNLTIAGTETLAGNVTSTNSVVIIAAATLDAGAFNLAFTADGTPFIKPAGTFTAGTGTVVYNNVGVTNIASTSYYNVILAGVSTLLDHTTTTAVMTLTSTGSLDAAGFNLAFTAAGTPFVKPAATFTSNLGTVIYSGVGATNIASTSYYNLIVSTTGSLLDLTTSTNVLTIADSGSSLDSGYDLEFTAAGTPFVNNGTFTGSAGSVFYTNAGATNIATGTYFALGISTAGTLVGNVTSTDALTLPNTFSLDAGVYNLAFTSIGTPFNKAPGATFTAGTGTVVYSSAGATNIASTSYYNVIVNGAGTLLDHTTSTNVLTLTNDSSLDAGAFNLAFTSIGTPFNKAPGATFTAGTGTVVYSSAGATNIASTSYYNVIVNGAGTLLDHTTSTNVLTLTNDSSLDAGAFNLAFTSAGTPFNKAPGATFTAGTGTVIYSKALNAINIASTSYNNIIVNGLGTLLDHTTTTAVMTLIDGASLDAGGFNLAFTAAGTPFAKAGATFTSNLGTVIYSGVGATNIASTSYYNLIVSTTGSLLDLTTSTNVLTIADSGSSLDSGYDLEFTAAGTPFVNNGTFTASAGSVFYTDGVGANIATGTYFGLGISTAGTLVGNVTSTDVLTLPNTFSLSAGAYNLAFTGSGTPFNKAPGATFTAGTGTVVYDNAGATNIASTSYYNVIIAVPGTLLDHTTTTNAMTIPNTFSLDAGAFNLAFTGAGTVFNKAPGATFTAGTGTVVYENPGVAVNIASTSYYNVIINANGTLIGNTTSTNVMTLSPDQTLDAAGFSLAFTAGGTPFVKPSGTFTANSGTVVYNFDGATNIASTTYYNLVIGSTNAVLIADTTSTNVITLTAGSTFNPVVYNLAVTGSGTPILNQGGTFDANGATVVYSNVGAVNIASSTYNNLVLAGTDTLLDHTSSTQFTYIRPGATFSIGVYNFAIGANGTPFVNQGGTFDASSGTVIYNGAGATNIASSTYNNLIINTTGTLLDSVSSTNYVRIVAAASLDIGTFNLALQSNGTPLLNLGTLDTDAGTVIYNGVGATNIASSTYLNLIVNTDGSLLDHTTTTNVLTLTTAGTLASAYNLEFTAAGTPFVNDGTFTASAGTVSYNNVGATNIATGTYYNLIPGTAATLVGNVTSTNVLTIPSGKSLALGTYILDLSGTGTPLVNNGSFAASSTASTVVYSGAGETHIAGGEYYDLQIASDLAILDANATSTNLLLINSTKTLDAANRTINLSAVGTPFVNNGTFTASTSVFIYSGAGETYTAAASYYDLQDASTLLILGANATSTNVLTINSGKTLDAGSRTLQLTGIGTPLVINGTWTASSSAVLYSGAGATNITSAIYYNLTAGSTNGILAGAVTSTNILTIPSTGALNATGYTMNLSGTGTPLVVSGTFTASTSTVKYSGAGATNLASETYYNLVASSTNGILGGNVTSTNALTINAGSALNLTGYIVNLTGTGTPLVINGTFTESTSTMMYSGAGVTNITTSTYYNLKVNSTNGILAGNVTSTNVLTVTAVGALNAGGYTTILTGSGAPFVVSGTLTESTSTFKFMSAGTVTTTAESYYNVTLGAGTYNLGGDSTSTGAFINGGTFSIASGRTLNASGTYNNNGTVTETGAIQHPSESSDITDNASTPVANVDTAAQIVYLTVEDQDGNLDASAVDTITGTSINASTYSDDENVTLTETGADTGIFRGFVSVALSSLGQDQNGFSELSSNGTFTLAFADSKDAGDTGSDTATYTGSTFNGSSGSSHGGGGGGGGVRISTPNPQPVTDPSVIGGINSQTLSFPDNSPHEVKIGTTVHHVTAVSATDKFATVIVESNPIKFVIRKNEVKKLDTNKDKKFDMSVTYLGFVSGVPKFIFKDLLPPKKVTTTPVVVSPAPSPVVTPVVTPPAAVVPVTPVVVPSSYQFTKDLRLGSNGKDVEELQKVLKSLGYFTVVPNGNYGPMTRASVMKFQQAKGISQVGAVGPATRAALNALSGVIAPTAVVNPSPVAPVASPLVTAPVQFNRNLVFGSNGADVKALQQILKNLGYFTVVPNGNYGPMTREAVIKFQKAKGIAPLGYVGPNTRNALNSL